MKKYLKAYLYNRPLFYIFIRPKELKLFRKALPFKKPILDFGCGDGFFTKALVGGNKIDVGVDVDNKILLDAEKSKVYNKTVLLNNYKNYKLPIDDNYFSTVISNCVMEHVKRLPATLKEIQRTMKHGGRFYLSVMTNRWNDYLIGGKLFGDIYLRWMKKIQNHPNLLSDSQWVNEFEKAGFRVVEKYGYINKDTARLIELFHYLSIDSLFTHKLFKKWVIFPERFLIIEKLLKLKLKKVNSSVAAAVFFTLEKV